MRTLMVPYFFRSNLSRVLAVLCTVGSFAASADAQVKGDRVVVTANFDTKIKAEVVGKVYEGSVHTVTETNGKWCELSDVPGWLPLQYTMDMGMALRHFTKRVKENPRDSIGFAHRGVILYELERYDEAFKDLTQSLSLNRENPGTWLNRGMVAKAQGKYQNAIRDFGEAIRLNPKQMQNAYFNTGLVFYSVNDFKQAVENYDKAIEMYDKHALWFVSRGSAKLALDDLAGAKADYEWAFKINGNLADAQVGLSNVALVEDDLETCFKHAELAVEAQSKNAMALNARGWVLYKMGKVDDAIFDLSRAVRYAPRLSIAYGNRGVCYVHKNEFDKAIADHTQHIKLDPRSPVALSNRGVAWFGKGDFAKAKADFEAAEKLAPDLDESLNGYAWFLATCPEEDYRDGALAVKKAKQACEISEHKFWYHLDTLATAHAELKEFDEAVKWAKQALEVAPQDKKKICQEQLARFERKEQFRSQVGKNAEQAIIGS
ncbi:MAG: tetratricopeptide (TPR) repeat protein [Mariniblastus sp.]|jgi:tetratricopeptide (TPR) repeat protein